MQTDKFLSVTDSKEEFELSNFINKAIKQRDREILKVLYPCTLLTSALSSALYFSSTRNAA